MHWPQAHSIPPGCRRSLHRGERNNSGPKPTAAGCLGCSPPIAATSVPRSFTLGADLDAALASPPIARRSTSLSSWLRSVKLAPAVGTDRIDHDFARGRLHKLNAGRAFLVVFWGILIFGNFVS